MNTTKLTVAEVKTLDTILVNGGAVRATMGALGGCSVRKTTLDRLLRAGLVRIVTGTVRPGPCRLDVEVTAAGCIAFNNATGMVWDALFDALEAV